MSREGNRFVQVASSIGIGAALALGIVPEALAQAPQEAPRAPAPELPAVAQPRTPDGRPAAQSQDAGPITTELRSHPALPDWTKVCNKEQSGTEFCYTTRDFVSNEGQPALAVAVFDATSGPQAGTKLVRFVTPLALLLTPGLRFATESGQGGAARFTICFPTGCYAETPVRDDVVNALKKAATLKVAFQNQVGREVIFSLPLEGLGRTYDAPPMEPEALRKQQEGFLKEAEQRAEALRKRLLEGSSGSSGVTSPSK